MNRIESEFPGNMQFVFLIPTKFNQFQEAVSVVTLTKKPD